ncbi:sperm flagellar protein 1-like isoform X2 [Macrosteles quadrilineatus]|uniref:sperm flagellar protein 1-like isoform X2 n=1 Tax=Macrosteles quadrilineatus TaxID=74068 RepID=UPI0023E33633|nr:sperm flagellar protein 1-like isoform X2 [Macrosteles quadrilineatus]XP_054290120.1 sperm flagellar protein 1-like isoform X2 [Macrosteles quadrilineatus]
MHAVLMAELCKYHFPKVVDLHNYPPANSHAAKVINWQTLNRKVFSKLQIKVTTDLIHQIAAGLPGALESVLLAIKNKVDYQQRQKGETDSGQTKTAWGDFGDGSGLNDHEDMFLEIKKLKNEVQLKNETISVLNQKVVHLEALLEIKDKRLRELTANVDRMKARQDDSKESFHSISA